MFVVGKLDREEGAYRNLAVECVDGGGLVAEVQVIVEVADVNDSPSKFDKTRYDFQVSVG